MRPLFLLTLVLAPAALAWGQQPPPPPPAPAVQAASVTYAVESEQRDPARFSLAVDLVGHAVYQADEAPGEEGEPREPYRAEFEVSPATRDRIFGLAQATGYFEGDFEFRKHRIAQTGRKTLTYRDGMRTTSTTLNWSENKQIQQLIDIFESIALTQSLARRLALQRRFDKLGLDATLKRMEQLRRSNFLGELQAIAPLLRQIAADRGVMKLARDRANRLLDQVALSSSGAGPAATRP